MRPVTAAACLLLLTGVTACGGGAQRDDAGAVTEADDVAVDQLRVGDCLETPQGGVVTDLTAIPCAQAHDGEVFHGFDLPDGDFPGDAEAERLGGQGCEQEFLSFVGTAFEDSTLELFPLTPVEEGWSAGDQGVLCIVQDPEGALVASLRGAKR